jgi:hypothetical protein
MRRLRLLMLLALSLSLGAAQGFGNELPGDSSAPGPVTKGFYFGATSSHFTGESCTLWSSRYGGNVGMYANFPLTDLLGLQLDMSYLAKGAQIEEAFDRDGILIRSAADVRLDYVQFAVLARLGQPRSRFRDEYAFRPKLLGGFALNTRVQTRVHGLSEEYEHFFQDTELSLIFGGGFDLDVWSNRAVTFDFRFDLGLSDVCADWKNNTARFLMGMTL